MLTLLGKTNFTLSLAAVILVAIVGILDETIDILSGSDEDDLTKEIIQEYFLEVLSLSEYASISKKLEFIADIIIWFEKHYIISILFKYILAITPVVNIIYIIILGKDLYGTVKVFFFDEDVE